MRAGASHGVLLTLVLACAVEESSSHDTKIAAVTPSGETLGLDHPLSEGDGSIELQPAARVVADAANDRFLVVRSDLSRAHVVGDSYACACIDDGCRLVHANGRVACVSPDLAVISPPETDLRYFPLTVRAGEASDAEILAGPEIALTLSIPGEGRECGVRPSDFEEIVGRVAEDLGPAGEGEASVAVWLDYDGAHAFGLLRSDVFWAGEVAAAALPSDGPTCKCETGSSGCDLKYLGPGMHSCFAGACKTCTLTWPSPSNGGS